MALYHTIKRDNSANNWSSIVLSLYMPRERCKRAWGIHPLHPNPLVPYPHHPTPNTLTPLYPHPHPHHPTPLLSHTLQPYLLSCYQCPNLPHLIRVKNSTISHYLTLSRSKFTIRLQYLEIT